jgi:hypothetical protein
MARPLSDHATMVIAEQPEEREIWLSRATARAFAAAISALLIATLVVNRSDGALIAEGTAAATSITSGTISLSDDDRGRSLFDLSAMAPGHPVIRCIEVIYDGTIVPVDFALKAEASGSLASFLDVTVDEGSGGSFETCEGFSIIRPVFAGTLAELAAGDWLPLGRMVNSGDVRHYRIRMALQDTADALGQSTSADFIWEVTPS